MAERFKEVLEVAIAATEDPSLKALLTTVGKLGDTGEIADEKLVELVETLTRVSQVDKAVSAFAALTQSQTDLADAAERAGLRLKLAAEQEADAAGVLAEKRAALEALKAQQDAYAASAERQVAVERELKQAVRDAGAEVRTAQQAWREAGTVLASASKDYDRTVESQGRLQAQLAPLARDIEAAGLSTQNLAAAQATLRQSSEQARSGIESIVQAAQAAAQAETALGDATEDSGERIREVVRASLERSNAEKAALAARQQAVAAEREVQAAVGDTADATERAAAGQDALRASANAIINDLRDYEEVLRRGATSVEEIADQEQRLDRLFQAGAITIEEQSDALAKLTKDEEALARAADLAAREQAKLTRETKTLGKESTTTDRVVDGLGKRLKQLAAGALAYLSLRKLKDTLVDILKTGDRFERLEQQLGDAFGSVDLGREALAKFREVARGTEFDLEAIIATAIRLKNQGLDPLDGSLEAVLNQSAALGGEQQKLESISRALGNAWAKQSLQAEQINQLAEAGVPVYDLLAKATGRTAEQVRVLSREGDLGREAIAALIAEMGKANDGAAARGLSTLTGLWGQLRKTVTDFFVDIANSGPLDFFKGQLASLQARIKDMAASGELKTLVTDIGGSIVALANGVRSVVGFLGSVAGSIISTGRAIKESVIGESIGEVAVAMKRLFDGAASGVVWIYETGKALVGLGEPAANADAALRGAADAMDRLATSTAANREENVKAAQAALAAGESSLQLREAYLAEAEAELARVQARREAQGILERLLSGDYERVEALKSQIKELRGQIDSQRQANEALEEAANANAIVADMERRSAEAARDSAQSQEELAAAIRGKSIKALEELGVSAEVAGVKFTESGRKILEQLRDIVADTETSSQAIGVAFSNALAKLGTSGELEQFRTQLLEAFNSGSVSLERFTQLSLTANQRQRELREETQRLTGALAEGGQAGEDASRRRIAALEAERQKLASVAADIASKITDALNKGADQESLQGLRDQFNAVDGQVQGLNNQLQQTQSELGKAGDEGQRRTDQLQTGLVNVSKSADQAGEQVAGAFNRVGAAQALRDAITAVAEEFYGLSDAAGQFFDKSLLDFARGERTILGVFDAINQAQAATRDAYTEQQEAAARQAQAFANLSDEAVERMVRSGVTADALQAKAGRLSQIFDLLGEQDLSGLRSALSAAASQVDALRGKAEGALESLRRMNDELEAERLRAEGDEAAIAARERDRRLQQIQDELEAAGAAGNELAARNRQLAEEAYQRRLQEIEDERRRRLQVEDEVAGRRRGNESSGASAGAGGGGGGSGAAAGSGASGRGPGTGQGGQPVVINIGGERLSLNLGGSTDVATLQRLIALLRRDAMASGLGGSALR